MRFGRGRKIWAMLAVLVSLGALLGVVRLTVPPGDDAVRRQLAFLRQALADGAGEQAQTLFPEGYFFSAALYGLTWVDLGLAAPSQRPEALQEARWALARLDSDAGRAPFPASLSPSYGIFYRGWSNWLRGGVLSLQPSAGRDAAEVARFEQDSAEIGAAFDASATPYLAAYVGQAWPVDSTVAVASLRLHDALLPPRFDGTVRRWLDGVRSRLDPVTGLMPHRVALEDGAPTEVARATSQSVIQRFLVEIDPGFARQQYLRFRELFVARPLGLGPAVREYPAGTDGPSDVDSGPLVLGVSLSATVVTIGAARVQHDDALAKGLSSYGEFAGLPFQTPWSKRYALGVLPIGDAFLAWSHSARPWVATLPRSPSVSLNWTWRLPLLTVLLLVGVAPWLPLSRGRPRRPRPHPPSVDHEVNVMITPRS